MNRPRDMSIEEELFEFAKSRDMILGICSADPLTHLKPILTKQQTPFTVKDVDKRTTPELFLPGAKSIIVAGLSYAKDVHESSEASSRQPAAIPKDSPHCSPSVCPRPVGRPEARPHLSSEGTGIMSQMAAGEDYHITLKNILEEAVLLIKEHMDFRYRICVDDGPLTERGLAVRAGLGFFGKNRMAISKSLGSFFNIGCIVTDLPLKTSDNDSMQPACGDCSLCVNACPGAALSLDGEVFDHNLCVSYLTQKKGILTSNERKLIGSHIYGCDICQIVCPYNRDIPRKHVPMDTLYPSLDAILRMTDDEFQRSYGKTVAGWRGPALLRRNAEIAMENSGLIEK